MFNFDVITNENNTEHNLKWPYIPDFMKIYKECTSKPYSLLTIDTTLPTDNPLCFRKNLLDAL